MLNRMKEFLKEEDGMGVVEIIIIIAVLVAIALFFRKNLFAFVAKITNQALNTGVELDPSASAVEQSTTGTSIKKP